MGMEVEFFEFLKTVDESNKADNIALHCAKIILKRAEEVHPAMRGYMIDSVVELIQAEGIKEKEVESPEAKRGE
jgi:hypothetical protein